MLTNAIKKTLKSNWGEKADTLHCYAEVKLIDPLSSWTCYIFAMDKEEETIHCLLYTDAIGIEICTQPWNEIQIKYNEEGEHPQIDEEYRRITVVQLLKRLINDTRRN